MARILVIEPDQATRHLLRDVLSPHFDVDVAAGPIAPRTGDDLIIVEPHAPGMPPDFGYIRALRAGGIATPVLILSAVADTEAIVRGLGLGADDYMPKPFHVAELVQRAHAVLRRAEAAKPKIIEVGAIAVDLGQKIVRVDGRQVHFTGKEYAFLELLALHKGAVVTAGMIMAHLYGGMDEPELKVIQVFVCKIRKKLGDAAHLLATCWGRGYALRESADEPGDKAPVAGAWSPGDVFLLRPGRRVEAAL